MKKIAALMFSMCLLVFTANNIRAEEWQEYVDNTYQLKINYPSDWTQKEGPTVYNVICVEAPKNDQAGYFQPFVGIKATELPPVPINLQQIARNTIKELKRTKNPKNKVSEASPVMFAGLPAHRVVYTRIYADGGERKFQQIFLIKDNMLYVITYGAGVYDYENNLSMAEKIVNSFVFL